MTPLLITVLSDDCVAARNARAEHGLCFHIETGDRRLLFDTGQGFVLADNAQALGIDLGAIDAIALSHGHYDHTGGLSAALAHARAPVDLYAHPDAFADKYHGARSIGIPQPARHAIASDRVRIHLSTQPAEIAPGLFLTGQIPRPEPTPADPEVFHLDPDGRQLDPLFDDQSLFFDTPSGLVLLLGCAHAGLDRILDHVERLAPKRPLRAVLGGMHLGAASPGRLHDVVEALRRRSPEILVPMHCTGPRAAAALWTAFPDACRPGGAGAVYSFQP
jgi:7,8-dihydropterin-6-yl-methyl-4-(beta-D-ribofuranosyl)aminobenzene 5'-phosphate synthase